MWWGRVQTPPRETDTPPPSIATPPLKPDTVAGVIAVGTPPLYVYTQRREPAPSGGEPSFLMAPWDNFETFYDLNIAWQDAPDPIRQSNFYAAGNKMNPGGGVGGRAQMNIVTNLAIGSRESVMEDTYRVGKLLGYMHRPMYAGAQQPWKLRANIQEAIPTTYGSQYQIQNFGGLSGTATATGFTLPTSSTTDGYPY